MINKLIAVPITLAVLFASPSNLASEPIPVREVAVEVSRSYAAVEVKQEPERLFRVALEPELQELVYSECMARDVEVEYALAIMLTENSSFNPSVISGTNDYGLFQINKINHARMAKLGYTDMLNPEHNIKAGIAILAECKNENLHYMAMAYNMGPSGAKKAISRGVEDTDYSRKVVNYYKQIKGGAYDAEI